MKLYVYILEEAYTSDMSLHISDTDKIAREKAANRIIELNTSSIKRTGLDLVWDTTSKEWELLLKEFVETGGKELMRKLESHTMFTDIEYREVEI